MKQLMESFRKFLDEAPKELTKDTGLYFEDALIVVYNYWQLMPSMRRALQDENHAVKVEQAILGAIRLGVRSGTMLVEEVWAQRGYGPLLYRLALERSGHHGLAPSRIKGEVSDAASKVWKEFYDGKGSGYAEHKPASDKIHGVEWLDSIYYSSGSPVDKDRSLALNNKIFNKIKDPYEERHDKFLEIVNTKLRTEMAAVVY